LYRIPCSYRVSLLKQLGPRQPPLFEEITALFLEQLECALLRLIARLCEALQRLLARRMLLLGNNAPLLRLHQVLARQPTARVLRRAVIDLRLCAHRRHLLRATIHHLTITHLPASIVVALSASIAVALSATIAVALSATIAVALSAGSVIGHYILYGEILLRGSEATYYIGSLGVFPDRISS